MSEFTDLQGTLKEAGTFRPSMPLQLTAIDAIVGGIATTLSHQVRDMQAVQGTIEALAVRRVEPQQKSQEDEPQGGG